MNRLPHLHPAEVHGHDGHDHASRGHDGRGHAHESGGHAHALAPRATAPTEPSLLRMSVATRLTGVAAAIAAIWGGVFWAVS